MSLDGMRIFRVLLVLLFGAFVLVAGLITAAAVSLGTAFILFVRRMLRQPGGRQLPTRPAQRFTRPKSGDVIDITATEVPADSHPR
ncbi:MAG: hypothetical protein ACREH8_10615 [Opitutaceae bacterium]